MKIKNKEYSNNFSLYELQELSKYFQFFDKIENILEDLANILQQNNYDIEKDIKTIKLILHISINQEFSDVDLTLYRNKSFNNNSYKKPSQIIKNINKIDNRKKLTYIPQTKMNIIETEKLKKDNNIGVKSIKELNKELTDLKDRITVLEVTQNTLENQNSNRQLKTNNYNNRMITNPGGVFSMGTTSLAGNEKLLLSMENIIKRINKLEEANNKKPKNKSIKRKNKII